jgi:hypothetical protein
VVESNVDFAVLDALDRVARTKPSTDPDIQALRAETDFAPRTKRRDNR